VCRWSFHPWPRSSVCWTYGSCPPALKLGKHTPPPTWHAAGGGRAVPPYKDISNSDVLPTGRSLDGHASCSRPVGRRVVAGLSWFGFAFGLSVVSMCLVTVGLCSTHYHVTMGLCSTHYAIARCHGPLQHPRPCHDGPLQHPLCHVMMGLCSTHHVITPP
jgi:hypothetical protein